MSWFTSLFPSKSSVQGRRKVLSATQEAFSLPSPVSSKSGFFTADSSLASPGPESARTLSFTYPPQSNGTQYGYIPTEAPSRSRRTSLLPLHSAPLSPLPQYPSLEQTWVRIRSWLSVEYPELGDTLNYGILPQDLANIETQFGFSLPQVIRESYLVVDGQEPESSAGCSEGLFFGLHLLPLDEVFVEWKFWREVDNDPNTGAHPRLREVMQSIPPGWIRKEYSQRGWIPLISDKMGNYIGIDLNPGEGGSVGQVIVFGRDFDTKVVLWNGDGPSGWARWLASFAEELESGEGFELGLSNESEGSEDDVGYEGYFFDGIGRGSGEGTGGIAVGGMRLSGEYRGWTTLEAWADRSLRKWHEAGLIPDPPTQEKGKAPEKVGLGVLDITDALTSSGAEIPIPVFADVSNTAPSRPKGQGNVDSLEPVEKAPIPVISVTKPPAPLPVELPTHDDITPPSPNSESHPDDIESSASLMREVSHPSRTVSEASNSGQRDTPIVPPKSTQRTTNLLSGDAISLPSIVYAPTTPLLDDSASASAPSPIKPPLPAESPRQVTEPLLHRVESPFMSGGESSSDVEGLDASATVRFVGTGGEVGLALDQTGSDQASDDDLPDEATTSMSSSSDEFFMAPSGDSHEKLSSVDDLGEGQPAN